MHFDIDTCLSIGSQDLVANLFLKYIYEPFFNFSCELQLFVSFFSHSLFLSLSLSAFNLCSSLSLHGLSFSFYLIPSSVLAFY
jgi:hypothetical protein